jgi:hypothetical protein
LFLQPVSAQAAVKCVQEGDMSGSFVELVAALQLIASASEVFLYLLCIFRKKFVFQIVLYVVGIG